MFLFLNINKNYTCFVCLFYIIFYYVSISPPTFNNQNYPYVYYYYYYYFSPTIITFSKRNYDFNLSSLHVQFLENKPREKHKCIFYYLIFNLILYKYYNRKNAKIDRSGSHKLPLPLFALTNYMRKCSIYDFDKTL